MVGDGIKRAIAQQILFYWGSILLLSIGTHILYLLGTDESPTLSLVYHFTLLTIT
jgi:hypothetical protein